MEDTADKDVMQERSAIWETLNAVIPKDSCLSAEDIIVAPNSVTVKVDKAVVKATVNINAPHIDDPPILVSRVAESSIYFNSCYRRRSKTLQDTIAYDVIPGSLDEKIKVTIKPAIEVAASPNPWSGLDFRGKLYSGTATLKDLVRLLGIFNDTFDKVRLPDYMPKLETFFVLHSCSGTAELVFMPSYYASAENYIPLPGWLTVKAAVSFTYHIEQPGGDKA